MRHKFFRGRVILSDQKIVFTVLLALCFFIGAMIGNGAAGLDAVTRSDELQVYLTSFFSMLQGKEHLSVQPGYTIFAYQKYPILVFALGFIPLGLFLIPIITFYLGFSFSFAVSAFLYTAPEKGVLLALLLFGLRCLVVLPCYFLLASDAMISCAAHALSDRRKGSESGYRKCNAVHLVICVAFLLAGAFLEYTFLPRLLLFI